MTDDLIERFEAVRRAGGNSYNDAVLSVYGTLPVGQFYTDLSEVRSITEALTKERDVLREALEVIAGYEPIYSYVEVPDLNKPGSPYDRGKEALMATISAIATKALEQSQ